MCRIILSAENILEDLGLRRDRKEEAKASEENQYRSDYKDMLALSVFVLHSVCDAEVLGNVSCLVRAPWLYGQYQKFSLLSN